MTRRHYDLHSLIALAAFEAVARHLNVTPGAVSKQVCQLETELERLLLHSHATGEALATSLHDASESVSGTLRCIRASGERRHVSVVSTMATMQLWLMPRLESFWSAHPEIVLEHIISDRLHDVPRPDLDLRIRYGDGNWPGEDAIKIQHDVVVAVASPAFLERQPITGLVDLAAAPLLSVEGANWDWTIWAGIMNTEQGPQFTPSSGLIG